MSTLMVMAHQGECCCMFTHRLLTKALKVMLVVLASVMTSAQAFAQVYGGVAYGVTDPVSQGVTSTLPTLEGDAGYRLFVGNRVSEKFAIEVSYVTLGEYAVGPLEGQAPDPDELQDTITLTSGDVSFLARLPIRRYVSVYAKVGVHYWRGERLIEANDTVNGGQTRAALAYDDVDFSAGLGADYRFSRRMGVTLEANAYKTVDVYNLMMGMGVYATF